jgi:replicative DNA helicase
MLSRSKSVNLNQSQDNISSVTELIIAKQRNGPVGIVKLVFNENQTKFLELDNLKNI